MKGSEKKKIESRVRVVNSRTESSKLWIEPWGDEFDLMPGEVMDLLFQGPLPTDPEVSIDDAGITVWGWTGSTVRVVKDGKEVRDYGGLHVPPFPVKTKSTA
jgi:hypothetical protein